MMVTNVRGHFKDVHGSLKFDAKEPEKSSFEVVIQADKICTGEDFRDAHLRSADFLDVKNFPEITFKSKQVEVVGANDYEAMGYLTIRGITREVKMAVRFNGQWKTPWWEGNVDKGPKYRVGFTATTRINRHDFKVSWNDVIDRGGIVVSNEIDIILDAEAWRDPAPGEA
jgi:polyisoprenoid-binding protein YceI